MTTINISHTHSFKRQDGKVSINLAPTVLRIDGEKSPEKWGGLVGMTGEVAQRDFDARYAPDKAYEALESRISNYIDNALCDGFEPFMHGQCKSIKFDLQVKLTISTE